MKHPVLARVFAVVLVIMAVILCGVGVYGLRNTFNERKENNRVLHLLQSRTEEYEELTDTLNRDDSITDLENFLSTPESVYDKEKSAHRVNLATYTATRSGLSMADRMMETELSSRLSGVIMNDYTLESLAGITPLLVYIYPELQDAANNVQAQVASSANDMKSATAQFRAATDVATSDLSSERNPEVEALAEQLGVPYESLINEQNVYTTLAATQFATSQIDGIADSAVGTAKQLVDYVDSFDSSLAQLEQFLPQLLQLLESKDGLKETKTDLVNSKTKLDKEKLELESVQTKLDELKSCDRKRTSLGVLLKTNSNIKEAVRKGGDLLTAAKAECSRMEKSVRQTFLLSLGTYIALILAGIAAWFGLPAAYEKTNSRVALVLPVVLFTVLSVLSEILCEINTGERQYAGIMAAIIGVIQLFILIPREHFPDDDE